MADDQRVYSDEEFALVLRTAADLAGRAEQPGFASRGLTLAEMKSAAAQAGLDPALIERAARMVTTRVSESPVERIVGGPFRHQYETRFAARLDEASSARLLSAARIAATDFDGGTDGHSSELGMTWKASGAGDVLSVVARPDEGGTTISVVLDRRGTFIVVGLMTSLAVVMSFIAGIGLYRQLPALAPWIPVAAASAGLAVVRGFWSSSTRKARERIAGLVDAMGQTLVKRDQ